MEKPVTNRFHGDTVFDGDVPITLVPQREHAVAGIAKHTVSGGIVEESVTVSVTSGVLVVVWPTRHLRCFESMFALRELLQDRGPGDCLPRGQQGCQSEISETVSHVTCDLPNPTC